MGSNKERLNRRSFLRLSAFTAAGAALGSCTTKEQDESIISTKDSPEKPTTEPSSTLTPTVEQKNSPTDSISPTPEATATVEPLRILGDNLTKDRLAMVFAGLGGGEIESEDEETINYRQLKRITENCWNMTEEELNEEQWSDTLRLIGILGLYKGASAVVEQTGNGETAVFNPGRHEDEIIYPQADLNFLRTRLNAVESLNKSREELNQIWPEKIPFLSGTDMTVYGVITAPESQQETNETRRALVSLTDYRRTDEQGRPRHYFAALPVFSKEQEKQKGEMVFLNKILEQQGLEFNEETLEVGFINSAGDKVVNQLNRFSFDEILLEEMQRECGWRFVDKLEMELIEDPIIPPAPKSLLPNEGRGKQGRLEESEYVVSILNEKGEWVDRAKAVYNREDHQWEWVEAGSEAENQIEKEAAPEIEGLRIVEKDGRVVYLAERENHYRLEADAYAGELVGYTLNRQKEWGVGLIPPVLKVLLEGKQDFEFSMEKSQQDIASDERKFPLPFDPRGLKFEAGEVKYTRQVTMADGSPFEMKRCFLGLDLPKGTTIYNPIGADSKDSPMTAYYAKHGVIFSSEERKERLAEKCLQEGFCLTTTSRVSEEKTRETIREYPKILDLQREDKRMLPFSIYLPWDSSGDQNVFAEIEKGSEGPREIVPLGDPLFVVDSREPAVQFAFTSDYPIMLEASQAETKLENLFQIDNQYVFILPSP